MYTVSFVDVVSVIIVMVVMRCYGDVAIVTVSEVTVRATAVDVTQSAEVDCSRL